MLLESRFFSCLLLSSLILLLCDAFPLPSGLLALIFQAHLLFLSFILDAGLLLSFTFYYLQLLFIFETLLLYLSFKLAALSSFAFTLKTSRLLGRLFFFLSLQLFLRKFSFSNPLPVLFLFLDDTVLIRELAAQLVMQIDL